MNKTLQAYARKTIRDGLAIMPDEWVMTFKRMYSHNNLDLAIDEVVKRIPEDRLDWAMTQVENSINKLTR